MHDELERCARKLLSSSGRGEEREFKIHFLLNDELKHPQNRRTAQWRRSNKTPSSLFDPLSYYSFIRATLLMVLRLALDVLTKLLIGRGGLGGERISIQGCLGDEK